MNQFRKAAASVVLATAALSLGAVVAHATAPGSSGKIVFIAPIF